MPTARFYVGEQSSLPHVCIKTGQPTSECVTLRVAYRPAWPLLLLPISILASVVGIAAGSRHVSVTVPMTGRAVARYRAWWQWTAWSTAITCCGFLLALTLIERTAAVVLLALLAASIAAHVGARLVLWNAVLLDRDCTVVTVTRCHPLFVQALRAARRA